MTLKNKRYWVLSFLISAFILFAILRLASWNQFIQLIAEINWIWVFAGAVLYVSEITLQGYRASVLFSDDSLPTNKVILVSNTHNFLNKIAPARLGELSFPLLSHRYLNTSHLHGFSVLILARFADALVVLTAFSLVYFLNLAKFSLIAFVWLPIVLWAVFSLFLYLLLVDGIGLTWSERLKDMEIGGWKGVVKSWLMDLWDGLRKSITLARQQNQLMPVIGYSVIMWLLIYGVFLTISKAIGLTLTVEDLLVAASFAIIGTILPIGGMGHIGSLEAGWVVGLLAVGSPSRLAATSALVIGILTTVYALILALFSVAYLEFSRRRNHSRLVGERE